MSETQYGVLRDFISSWVDDENLSSGIGWEETTYASTAHLLRTCLSKKQNPNQAINSQTVIE